MPKNVRRVTVERTVTYRTTIDLPGYTDESDANMLVLLGGADGKKGTLAMGELLAGSDLANNGSITKSNWSVTARSNVEPYITRPNNAKLSVGTRVVSVSPRAGKEAALGKLFIVTQAGTTADLSGTEFTEPNWAVTDGGVTSDGTVKYMAIPRFYTVVNFAAGTLFPVGTVVRPGPQSNKEFLVTTATVAAATGVAGTSAPTWTNIDVFGASANLTGGGALLCIAGAKVYAQRTYYELGDIVHAGESSTAEFIVTSAGRSNTSDLSAAKKDGGTTVPVAGDFVTLGGVTFKMI